MTRGSDRVDRIERILEQVAKNQEQISKNQEEASKNQEQISKSLHEVAARQQYHDEAFERFGAEMNLIKEAIAADAENIRALVRIAELHHRRLEGLEGGEAA